MRHFLRHWRRMFKAISFLVLAAVWVGCKGTTYETKTASASELKKAHQRACGLQGDVIISMSKTLGEDCVARTARLNELVKTDEDCKAFFGDRKVQVSDVCD